MGERYKILLSNRSIYREVLVNPDEIEVRVGTGLDCNVRLHKKLFFEPFEIVFRKIGAEWTASCTDNIYFSVGDIRKLLTIQVKHGDVIWVRYNQSNNEVFILDFKIDFESDNKRYERAIQIQSQNQVTIGSGAFNQIVVSSPYVQNDNIILSKSSGNNYIMQIQQTQYGIYHNGNIAATGENIQNGDFLAIGDFVFCLKDGVLWTEIRQDIQVKSISYRDYPKIRNYPIFDRNTRVKTLINEEKIEVLDPPNKAEKPKNNLLMRLLPSVGMLGAAGVMALMGGMMIVFSLISSSIAIITAIVNMRESKKEFARKTRERLDVYYAYINRKQEEIQVCRAEELRVLSEKYISLEDEKRLFDSFSSDLFDRTMGDDDFLCVRLGLGDIDAKRELDIKKQEKLELDDDLQEMPALLEKEYKKIKNAPVVCNLAEANAVGIIVDEQCKYPFFTNIVMDLCARHYHADVNMYFISEEKNKDKIHELRFLPHLKNEVTGTRNIICDDESKNFIFEYLYKELTERSQTKKVLEEKNRLVVFFYDEYGFKNHPISKFVSTAKELGVTFIFFAHEKSEIPQGCEYLIRIKNNSVGTLIDVTNKDEAMPFNYTTMNRTEVAEIIKTLAPIRTEEVSLEGTLTKNISIFQLLNILSVDDINPIENWRNSKVFQSMKAPLGVTKSGIVHLDLSDKAHGPHGLVAGTTGSGKSEILQTYILSMATLYHPYEVGFVIIDFKGGGMVNQFKNLPHLLGAITNIDGKEIDRSLKSIKAELQKRQQLFAEAEVNHIDKYIIKYKSKEVSVALPHLIVIVDEFAELKAEQPEFMKELISAARIGRSLGVHLILATQKPSGQVNEQIWSNSRFKLCLKVQSQEDSNEVLKSPLAAEIKEPGRAYLQVGNNEIFELFQSAYSGAPEKVDEDGTKEFTIYDIASNGKKTPVFVQKKAKSKETDLTQLDALVSYIAKVSEHNHIKKLSDICLPSLEKMIPVSETFPIYDMSCIPIGIYDDPETQYQGIYSVDLLNQNLFILGSVQSGKTNLLQTLIRNISECYSPKEVSIYIIDFASMVLKTFEQLNQIGGVVVPSEDEKLKNLFKMLQEEIVKRKEILMSLGVSSYSAYKEAGKKDLPHMVLIIDNLTVLKELYFQDDDELLYLCREGLTVGISVVIANAHLSGIGYKYLSNFAGKIALYCNDRGEYNNLFTSCREQIDDIHGRSLVEVDKKFLECQTFLAFQGEKEIHRVESIRKFIEENNKKNPEIARMIPVIPDVFTDGYVCTHFVQYMKTCCNTVFGFDYDTVTPYVMNLNEIGVLAIAGQAQSGKHNFVKYLVSAIERVHMNKSKVYVLDGISRKLAILKSKTNVKAYEVMPDKVIDMILEIEEQLRMRYEKMMSDNLDLNNEETIVLVLDNIDAIQVINDNKTAMDAYRNIVSRYKRMNVCVIISCLENAPIPYGAPEILKNIKESKHVLYFDDLKNMKIFDLSIVTMRQFKKPIELGDCYYMKDTNCIKLKTPMCVDVN